MIFNCCDDNHTIRIIVLTYNRPMYLFRLLRSIEEADYNFQRNNPHWNLILEIRIDVGSHKLVHSPLYTKRRKEKVIIILIHRSDAPRYTISLLQEDRVQKIARKFKFSHGKKIVHIEEQPRYGSNDS